MMHTSQRLVYQFIQKYKMVAPGQTVLAAVSGGADSMCLLDILLGMDIRVMAAHYNHGLRGMESNRDQEFVREYCLRHGVEFFTDKGDVRMTADAESLGIEETARLMRYEFLQRVASQQGVDKIATAHNADDNAETVLMNISRGAGLDGLCGIPVVRDNIIRPLLCLTRTGIETYLEQSGVPNIFDSSNDDQSYRRNRIRHSVMGVLKEINPGLSMAVLSMTERIRQDRECLDALAQNAFERLMTVGREIRGPVKPLMELNEAIRSRTVRLGLGKIGVTGESRTVRAVMDILSTDNPSAVINLKNNATVRREYGDIVFSAMHSRGVGFESVELENGMSAHIPELELEVICKNGKINNDLSSTFYFKCSSICGKITVRPRNPGDKIRLMGRACTKTIKKLFIEEKVPEHLRDRIPVFADENGVIAIMGFGIAERCNPGRGDEILSIIISKTESEAKSI